MPLYTELPVTQTWETRPKRPCGAARSMPGNSGEAGPAEEEAKHKPPAAAAISLARQCEEVARLKANALAAEDFDVAKRCKAVLEALTVLLTRETEGSASRIRSSADLASPRRCGLDLRCAAPIVCDSR